MSLDDLHGRFRFVDRQFDIVFLICSFVCYLLGCFTSASVAPYIDTIGNNGNTNSVTQCAIFCGKKKRWIGLLVNLFLYMTEVILGKVQPQKLNCGSGLWLFAKLYSIFAFQKSFCYCSDLSDGDRQTSLVTSQCRTPCPGEKRDACGDDEAMSVYKLCKFSIHSYIYILVYYEVHGLSFATMKTLHVVMSYIYHSKNSTIYMYFTALLKNMFSGLFLPTLFE